MKVFDLGLKGNWKSFKKFMENGRGAATYYFVIEEGDCGDTAYVFTNNLDLDRWLEKEFWDRERYHRSNLEDSMDDFKVWKLIPETDINRLRPLHNGSKPTSIIIDGERYFRKLIPVNVRQTIIVSTSSY